MRLYRLLIPLFLLVALMSCRDLFNYSPHEVILDEEDTDLISKGIISIKDNALDDDTIKFVVTGDSQGRLDEVRDFVYIINRIGNVDFTLICGDLTNYGLADEFEWLHEELEHLNQPYLPVIGNHDFIANGPLIFEKMYGPFDYSFKLGEFKFVAVNTNSIELAYDGSVPNMNWLTSQLADTIDIKNIFVYSHIMPWDDAFDSSLERPFVNALEASKVKVSFHGHHHNGGDSYHYNDGVNYVVTGSTGNRKFKLVKLWNDGDSMSLETIYF